MASELYFIFGLLIATARVGLIKARSINVDTRVPIVRISPDSGNSDAFGFALALHRIDQVNPADDLTTAISKTRVIVGAPKGTFPGGLNLPDPEPGHINRTGLIYTCTIASGSMNCDAIQKQNATGDIDSLRGTGRLFDHTSNAKLLSQVNSLTQAEAKEDQLLGATVYSNGDTVVMCAPLWTSTGRYDSMFVNLNDINQVNRLPKGRCYWTNRDLTQVNFLDPCNAPGVNIIPTQDRSETFCTAGTGVSVFSTATNSRVFAVGVPGYDRGTGALFWGSTQQQLENRAMNNDFGRGNSFQRNSSDLLDYIIEVGQGFQVTNGYITQSRNAVNYVPNVLTSAPRYNNTDYTGTINVYNVDGIQNLLSVTAKGQQFGEYFGYSLTTADINNDSYDEVIVGAPMYSNVEDIKVETGRTYIFRNTGGDLSSVPIIFEGSVPKGRFGMSAVNLGDIDRDGYEDIAIGAPYEVNGDSTGVVYIYYGSSNFTAFQQQTPFKIRAQDIKDKLSSVPQLSKLETFGFSLSSGVDVDNNGYNDLAIGAFESKAVFIFRSLPVANVIVELFPLETEVLRVNKNCNVNGVSYACFEMRVIVRYTGDGLSGQLDVTIVLSEVQSNNEQRVFFGQNPTTTTQSLLLKPNPSGNEVVKIYLMDNIVDSKSNITIMATVQQNPLRPLSASNGQPPIVDLDPDFRIRIPTPTSTEVELRNNCGNDNICETDSSLDVQTPPTYLPSGRNYNSIEVGGVKQVRFRVTLTNTGTVESAISLMLTVQHSRPGVFSDQLTVVYVNSSDTETCASPCNIRELDPSESMVIEVTLSVLSQVTVGYIETTFNLTSTQTVDNNINNNKETVTMRVERRAKLSVSLFFPSEVTYTDMQPTVQDRSDVGPRITLEVTASNVGSSTINNARLEIYYPAQSSATGSNLFFLLPESSTSTSVIPPSSSTTIMCDHTALEKASTLQSSGGKRKKRHTVSPAFRRQRREVRVAKDSASLFDTAHQRITRQETAAQTTANNLDCSSNQEECLQITCNITGLQGQGRTSARIILGGYVDQRFFADKSDTYTLIVSAVLTFDSMSENTTNDRNGPASNTTQLKLKPEPSGSSGENAAVLIVVVIVILLVGIAAIIVVGIILYCCGFLRRKKKAEKEEGEVAGVTVTQGVVSPKETGPTGTKDENTTL